MSDAPRDFMFEVDTPLGFRVRVSRTYWEFLTTVKHPVMAGRAGDVQAVLSQPDEVRRSRSDPDVLLFYKASGPCRWACAICKRLNGDGFLITAYPTDAIKEGDRIWPV